MGRREGADGPSRAGRVVSPHVAGLAPTIGRDTELRDLRAVFGTSKIQVLTGMGGVGKTSLARAYAQRHLADYGIVWWIHAEDPAGVGAEFLALLEILLPPGEAAQVRNARTLAFAHLAKQNDPWLLVLDNVPGAEVAHGLVPPTGNGHILITSRATHWPEATRVEPLGTEAAVELLTGQSGDADAVSANELAGLLGGLPLALTQAASFVKANATDLETYLRLYRRRSAEMHRDGRPADYPHTVATTWELAMDRLGEPAREMLNVFAFCAPEDIPVHAIFGAMDELVRHRALGELIAHSLVSPASNGIVVHRLVQAVTRARLGPGLHEWTDKARELIMTVARETFPEHGGHVASLITWHLVERHSLAVLDHHLPPEHPDTMAARFELAELIGHWLLGDPKGARDLLAALLPVQRRVLGDEHPDTMQTWGRLAIWTSRAGAPAQARDLVADLVRIQERALGAEHVHTLTTRSNMASWTGYAGDAAGARDLLAELVPIAERAEHPDILIMRHNFAYWTGAAGNASRARDLFAELVSVSERMFGADHPETASTRREQEYWAELAGQVEEEGPGGDGES